MILTARPRRLLAPSAAALLLCAAALGAPQGRSADDLVADLAGGAPDAAIAALVELGPSEAAGPLSRCVRSAPAEHAWQALRAFGALSTAADAKERGFQDAVDELARVAADPEAQVDRRRLAALALARLRAHAGPACGALEEVIANDEAPPQVSLAAALALGATGEDAAKRLQAGLKRPTILGGLWSLVGLGALGPDGSSAKSALSKLIEDKDAFEAFVLARAALEVLERGAGERAAARSRKKREGIEARRTWGRVEGGINWGAPMPRKADAAYTWIVQEARLEGVARAGDVALPDVFPEPMNGAMFTVADALQGWLHHATLRGVELSVELHEDRHVSWAAWSGAAEPLDHLLVFLDRVAALAGQ